MRIQITIRDSSLRQHCFYLCFYCTWYLFNGFFFHLSPLVHLIVAFSLVNFIFIQTSVTWQIKLSLRNIILIQFQVSCPNHNLIIAFISRTNEIFYDSKHFKNFSFSFFSGKIFLQKQISNYLLLQSDLNFRRNISKNFIFSLISAAIFIGFSQLSIRAIRLA